MGKYLKKSCSFETSEQCVFKFISKFMLSSSADDTANFADDIICTFCWCSLKICWQVLQTPSQNMLTSFADAVSKYVDKFCRRRLKICWQVSGKSKTMTLERNGLILDKDLSNSTEFEIKSTKWILEFESYPCDVLMTVLKCSPISFWIRIAEVKHMWLSVAIATVLVQACVLITGVGMDVSIFGVRREYGHTVSTCRVGQGTPVFQGRGGPICWIQVHSVELRKGLGALFGVQLTIYMHGRDNLLGKTILSTCRLGQGTQYIPGIQMSGDSTYARKLFILVVVLLPASHNGFCPHPLLTVIHKTLSLVDLLRFMQFQQGKVLQELSSCPSLLEIWRHPIQGIT
jgi:hypothetical protein